MATEDRIDEQDHQVNGLDQPNAQYMGITVEPGSRATFKSHSTPIPLLVINLHPFCNTDEEFKNFLTQPLTIDINPPTDQENDEVSKKGNCIIHVGGKKRPNDSTNGDNTNKRKKCETADSEDCVIKEEIKEEVDDFPENLRLVPPNYLNADGTLNNVNMSRKTANNVHNKIVPLTTKSFFFTKVKNSVSGTKYKCMQCHAVLEKNDLREHAVLCLSESQPDKR